jgi:hypothetical protein
VALFGQASHHAANLAAIAFPVVFITDGNIVLAFVASCLGVAWYIALFIDRHQRKKRENGKDTR